jgi:hypothetical protein
MVLLYSLGHILGWGLQSFFTLCGKRGKRINGRCFPLVGLLRHG